MENEKKSVITELYEIRNSQMGEYVVKKSSKYNNLMKKIKNKCRNLLRANNTVSKEVEDKIDSILVDIFELSEFWEEKFYAIGFSDGLNLKNESTVVLKMLR